MKQTLNFEIGKKVRGYGFLNEFGEFEFTPEETGSRQGRIKIVKTDGPLTVSTTKNNIIFHLCFPRQDSFGLTTLYLRYSNKILQIIKDYAF